MPTFHRFLDVFIFPQFNEYWESRINIICLRSNYISVANREDENTPTRESNRGSIILIERKAKRGRADEQRLKKVLHTRRLIKSRSEAAANKLLLFITFHAQQQTKKFYVSTAPTFRATLFFISLVERKTERAKRYIGVCESVTGRCNKLL